ncbi:MAG TPA: glucose-6-phosphate isomerase, partial [Burkholderiaceae bacterium]
MLANERPEWRALTERRRGFESTSLAALMASDPQRAKRYAFQAPSIGADLSRHWIDDATLADLLKLARASNLESMRRALFEGEGINT